MLTHPTVMMMKTMLHKMCTVRAIITNVEVILVANDHSLLWSALYTILIQLGVSIANMNHNGNLVGDNKHKC